MGRKILRANEVWCHRPSLRQSRICLSLGRCHAEVDERKRINPCVGMRLGFEGSFELAVKTFNHAVCLRVVGCCPETFGTKKCHEI